MGDAWIEGSKRPLNAKVHQARIQGPEGGAGSGSGRR